MSDYDPYIAYTHAFFRRWARVYDLFAASISPAYRAAVRTAAPCSGSTLLDICTGTGEIALRCAVRGATVTGVDVTPEMLEKARRKARRRSLSPAPTFEIMDARRLRFADRSFEVVVISFGLHDMPRQVRVEVLTEAARVCCGRLIVLDYSLPASRLGFTFWFRTIALFESPYFRSFVREDPGNLFLAAGLPAPARKRLRLLPFSIFTADLTTGAR